MGASICLLHIKQRTFFQVIFLLPYVVAPIANALIWLDVIYSPVTGLFGYLRSHFGWMWLTSPLTKPSSALFGVAAVDIWHYWGYLCVVYLAALRQTPADHLEAATLDGCTGWQLFRYIYFPSMLPTFKLMMMLIVIQSFMQFDYVYLLTSGGPANATEMMGTQTYTYAFTLFQFGKAGAIAVMMSLIGLVASIIYTRLSRNEAD
jgi:raffinose/stachyose/melibiose transport system permease protein